MSNYEPLFERPTGSHPPREVLKCGIMESVREGEAALFDVLPGVGKSRSIPEIAKTGIPITVLTNLTKNYEQYERWGQKDGIKVQKLPVATDLCPTLQDKYPNDPTANKANDAYSNGWPASVVHREFAIPCEQGNQTCPYQEATDQVDPDGPELLVGHFTQAYNPAYVEGRVVVIDEACFDDFTHEIKNPVVKAEEFISTLNAFPFDGLPYKPTDTELEEAIEILKKEGLDPADYRSECGEFHAKAPLIAYALLIADKQANDWFVADLPGNRTATFYQRPGRGSLHILDPPDFSGTEALIALDATPCLSDWERIIGDDIKHYRLFDDEQRNRYLSEQGYEFIQLNSHVWPASDAGVSLSKCEAYLREVYRENDQRPDLISSKKIIEGGKNWKGEPIEGLEDRDLDHLWDDDLHYGNLRGKNDLSDSELLVVLGSPSRPDMDIQSRAAFHNESAVPATDDSGNRLTGYDLDYQSDAANEYIKSVRRGNVFQAAMRAGRAENTKATVYIATGMVPDWLDTKRVGRRQSNGTFDACRKTRNDSDQTVLAVLRKEDAISGREIARRADLPKSTTLDVLNRLRDEDLVEIQGRGRGTKWHSNGVENVNIAGNVDLERLADFPYNNSIRAPRPFSDPVMPRRDPPDDPENRYPDWMSAVMRWAGKQRMDEQSKHH